jgi:WD40 repeat protein
MRVAFSPDGALLAAGGSSPDVTVWSLADHKVLHTLKGGGHHGVLAFRPDGKFLSTGSTDGKVRVWDLADGTLKAAFDHVPARLPAQYVYGLAYSPDGALLASSGGAQSVIRIWNPATSRLERSFGTYGSATFCIAFSPDGAFLLAGSEDGKIRVFSFATGFPTGDVAAHPGGVRALAFSPDGKTLATAGVDKTARLWDYADGKLRERRALAGHSDMVLGLAFSRDGKELATASPDGSVRTWDADRGAGRRVVHRGRRNVRSVAYGPADLLAVGLWTLGTPDPNVLLYGAGVVTEDPH